MRVIKRCPRGHAAGRHLSQVPEPSLDHTGPSGGAHTNPSQCPRHPARSRAQGPRGQAHVPHFCPVDPLNILDLSDPCQIFSSEVMHWEHAQQINVCSVGCSRTAEGLQETRKLEALGVRRSLMEGQSPGVVRKVGSQGHAGQRAPRATDPL